MDMYAADVTGTNFAIPQGEETFAPAEAPALVAEGGAPRRANLLIVIEDKPSLAPELVAICDYLGIMLRPMTSAADLDHALEDYRPLAVISEFEGSHQDGGHVLKSVALHDTDLPVMLLAHGNALWQGAIDAMVETLALANVRTPDAVPTMGEMVDFLARAARHARCRRMPPRNGN